MNKYILSLIAPLALMPSSVYANEEAVVNPTGILSSKFDSTEDSKTSTKNLQNSSNAVLTTAPANFSVTVPMSLPIDVAADGTVTTATTAKIVNNSNGRVKVTDVAIDGVGNWNIIAFDSDMSTYKVNEKKLGFTLNGGKTDAGGFVFNEAQFPGLAAKNDTNTDELLLDYDAVITPQSNAVVDEEVARVAFTVDWDSSESAPEPIHMTAQEATTAGYTYELLTDDTYSLTGMPTTVENVVFPTSIEGKAVTALGFYGGGETYSTGNKVLKSVVIPEHVTEIQSYAFAKCFNLTTVNIPDSVTYIGNSVFEGCKSLTSINIGNGVKTIDDKAFFGSGLISVNIPDSVTEIKEYDDFGSFAFAYCPNLTSVTIGNGLTSIPGYLFQGSTSLTSVVIGNSVKTIGALSFDGCTNLTSVAIPDSVTSIGLQAFKGCTSLTSVTIGKSVTSIGEGAFYGCDSLTSIVIPEGVTSIGTEAFIGSGLTSVTIPNSVTEIGVEAFAYCPNLTSVTIGNGVTSIGASAFSDCEKLTSVTIPNTVTSIGATAFNAVPHITYHGTATGAPWGAKSIN